MLKPQTLQFLEEVLQEKLNTILKEQQKDQYDKLKDLTSALKEIRELTKQ